MNTNKKNKVTAKSPINVNGKNVGSQIWTLDNSEVSELDYSFNLAWESSYGIRFPEMFIRPMLVLLDGQLYSKIIVQIDFQSTLSLPYNLTPRTETEGFTINTVTGQIYELGETPFWPTFTESE